MDWVAAVWAFSMAAIILTGYWSIKKSGEAMDEHFRYQQKMSDNLIELYKMKAESAKRRRYERSRRKRLAWNRGRK